MNIEKLTAFKTELRDLLEKYNVHIGVGCDSCSDLFGVSGEYTYVYSNDDKKEYVLVEEWGICANDLED